MDHHQHHRNNHPSHHHHQQPPSHHHNNQHHQHHQQSSSSSHGGMYTPQMISTPNYTRFSFNSPPPSNPTQVLDSLSSPYSGSGSGDGSNGIATGGGGGGYEIDPTSHKKKRGRPRKYSPDNNNINSNNSRDVVVGGGGGGGSGNNGVDLGLSPLSDDPSSKKNRGRPSGSSKKQLDALGNCGVGFTPHVILVNAGEDIASKLVAFSRQGARTVCVLSANGSICNVDLRQSATSGGIVKYEGQYEIISLSGSFLFSENSSGQLRTGGLSVSLAGTDGRVLGGGVVGVLRAASPVQIIVGSFIADGKKPKYMPAVTKSSFCSPPPPPPVAAADSSPPSQDVSTEEYDENGSNHIHRNMGSYGDSNHHIHHNLHMNWPNPNSNILPN